MDDSKVYLWDDDHFSSGRLLVDSVDSVELDYWTLFTHQAGARQLRAEWKPKTAEWRGSSWRGRPSPEAPTIEAAEGCELKILFVPSNPEIARPQEFQSGTFSFQKVATNGALQLLAGDTVLAKMATGTGEWIIDPGFSYWHIVFSAVPFETLPFTPQARTRLGGLAAERLEIG